jgi:DNA topoisomerase I
MPRLRRSDCHRPGITRRRRGKGFSYAAADGTAVKDPATLERIRELVIPPAWTDVWISPYPNGHIQATGLDDAGRRQYIYHPRWRELKDREKFDRALELGAQLPSIRRAITRDLRAGENIPERAYAAAMRLVDGAALRIGSVEYAETNGSFGATTLIREHVQVSGNAVRLDFPGKSGQQWEVTLDDEDLAAAVKDMLAAGEGAGAGDDAPALGYPNEAGDWCGIDAARLNDYLRDISSGEFTAKDFRTWQATVLAAMELARTGPAATATARRKALAAAMRNVAEHLGNTPAIARKSYVDPRLVDRYFAGEVIDVAPLAASEKAVRALLNS